MGQNPLDEMVNTALIGESSADAKRIANRRLFREMVRGETSEGMLTMSRRRALVRFAKRLSILPAEAKLIIRAVEYERGFVPAEMVLELMRGERRPSVQPENVEAALRIGFYVLLTLLYCLLVRWVVSLVF